MSTLLLFMSIMWHHVSTLFMSDNRLVWTDANQYCVNHCSSTLASIHDGTQYLQIVNDIIPNSIDISSAFSNIRNQGYWIGLNKRSTTNLEWNDGSPFDYGSTYSSDPWNPNQPSGGSEDCVHLWNEAGYKWNDISCTDTGMRFICNNCKGKLQKYIYIQQSMTWSAAETFCTTNIGTSLASIHSQSDQDEIYTLCSLGGVNCWIGLSDSANEGTWSWQDGTSFDYGTNNGGGVTSGDYPWANSPDNEPNGGTTENCVQNHKDKNYRWNDEKCSSDSYVICNMPSEICFSNNWKIMQNPVSLSWTDCTMTSQGNSIAIINKQWLYTNDLWVIEYIYTATSIQGGYGESSITIYHFNTICDYYQVGIAINGNAAHVFIYSWIDDVKSVIFYSSALFTYQFGTYYALKIELSYTTEIIWNVYINDIKHTGTNGVTSQNYAYLTHYKYVGIENKDMSITAKSLFISEIPHYFFTDPQLDSTWLQCTPSPTDNPTITPTKSPSDNPSISPTKYPTKTPTKYPSNNPSIPPTKNPSNNPSISPTNYPSKSPTKVPTKAPSKFPTVSPLKERGVDSVLTTEINYKIVRNEYENDNFEMSEKLLDLLIIIISCVIGCCCVILFGLFCIRYQMKQTEESDDDDKKRNNLNQKVYQEVLKKGTLNINRKQEGINTNMELGKVQSFSTETETDTKLHEEEENQMNENENNLNLVKQSSNKRIPNKSHVAYAENIITIGARSKSIKSVNMNASLDGGIVTMGSPSLVKTEKINISKNELKENDTDDEDNNDALYEPHAHVTANNEMINNGKQYDVNIDDDDDDDDDEYDNYDNMYVKGTGQITDNGNDIQFNHDIDI